MKRSKFEAADDKWPRQVRCGRVSVTVYRRKRADNSVGYEVSSYATGKRKLESYPTSEKALDRAADLARRNRAGETEAAELTNGQAVEYTSAAELLRPHGVTLLAAAHAVVNALKLVQNLSELEAAAKQFARHNQKVVRKSVVDVVAELIEIKRARKVSGRFLDDLESRLGRFGRECKKAAGRCFHRRPPGLARRVKAVAAELHELSTNAQPAVRVCCRA